MSATFSINIGQLTEATRKPDILSVLNDIQDNTQKLISPRDVRDAFLSTWANSPFKVTTPNTLANFEYIGIDSNNPSNKDIKQKILLGKRSYGNLDIMNSTLLNSNDADIFIFNTKPDAVTQSSTKIAILAGTNSQLFNLAPYIESKVNSDETAIDLNIINPSENGGINLISTTGRVSINNIIFPTISETTSSVSDGKILRYSGNFPNGYLKWEEPTITLNQIGTPGYPTNIFGSPVNVNGYPIEFVDDNTVPNTVGGVKQGMSFSANSFSPTGSTFQNWPITEVIKQLLYPYTQPTLELSVINTVTGTNYAEVGTTPSCVLTYKVTTYQRNDSEKIINYEVIPQTSYTGQQLTGVPGTFVVGTISVATFSALQSTKSWTLRASDSTIGAFSYSATASLDFIYPVFYGFTSSLIDSVNFKSIVPTLSKLISPYPGTGSYVEVPFNGDGYLYFIHPSNLSWVNTSLSVDQYGLQQIKDPNGFIIHNREAPDYSGFTSSIFTSTLNGYIGTPTYPTNYVVWRTKYKCAYIGPSSSNLGITQGYFKFIF